MNTITIAIDLAEAYRQKSEYQVDIDRIKGELYRCELQLTPVEGWPGKNPEQRDLAKKLGYESSVIWVKLSEDLRQKTIGLTLLNGEIDALEAHRRGAEWDIRANLVTVMAGKLRGETASSSRTSAVEDAAFDDAAGREMDDQVFGKPDHPVDEPEDIPLQDSLAALRKVSDELNAMANGEYDLSGVASYQTAGRNVDDELDF